MAGSGGVMTDTIDVSALADEFPREAIHWRVQGKPYERQGSYSAMALAYIDARDVMDKLDAVCGPDRWQDRYDVTSSGLIICQIGIFINGDWVWKSDGAGETAVEGKKGGMSDALKRCAVKWGVGRYLYRLDSPWVACEVRQSRNGIAWKKWAEDPWSKVKVTTYNLAEELQAESAFEVACQSAISSLEKEPDMEGLVEFWKDLNQTNKQVAADPRVIEAKNERKNELTKEAA